MSTTTKRLLTALAVVAALLFIVFEAANTYTAIQTARKAKADADLSEIERDARGSRPIQLP